MSALDEFKQSYSLERTAKLLTEKMKEEIGVSDVLQLALDGHIKLSWSIAHRLARRVAPECRLSNTVDPKFNPEWRDYDGEVRWERGCATRQHKKLQVCKTFAYLSCFPVDDAASIVDGLFRFHPEFPNTHQWLSLWIGRSLDEENLEWDWNKHGGIFLSDQLGQMWDFLDPHKVRAWEHESITERELLPRISQVVVQRVDLEAFEAEFMTRNAVPVATEDENVLSSQTKRATNNLLRIIGLMANHRYSGDIEKPYSIAARLAEKAAELNVNISIDTIAKHLNVALSLLKSEKK
jgi:hypothetical protein